MLRGLLAMVLVVWLVLVGCDRAVAPAPAAAAAAAPAPAGEIDPELIDTIAQATFDTSPPGHPTLGWPELAPRIEAARSQLERLAPLARPAPPADPMAERVSSAQVKALGEANRRAMVLRAESARLLARADPDGAAVELADMLDLARNLATWGAPATAESAAAMIERVLDAMERPEGFPMTRALTSAGRARLREALRSLDENDPAGRMRAMSETTSARLAALGRLARGPDGPTVVRGVAVRYTSSAELGDAQSIDRASREAYGFSRALADGWDRASRSAITSRLRGRQAEDSTGVLVVVLGDAADACDRDAALRERLARAIGALQ